MVADQAASVPVAQIETTPEVRTATFTGRQTVIPTGVLTEESLTVAFIGGWIATCTVVGTAIGAETATSAGGQTVISITAETATSTGRLTMSYAGGRIGIFSGAEAVTPNTGDLTVKPTGMRAAEISTEGQHLRVRMQGFRAGKAATCRRPSPGESEIMTAAGSDHRSGQSLLAQAPRAPSACRIQSRHQEGLDQAQVAEWVGQTRRRRGPLVHLTWVDLGRHRPQSAVKEGAVRLPRHPHRSPRENVLDCRCLQIEVPTEGKTLGW